MTRWVQCVALAALAVAADRSASAGVLAAAQGPPGETISAWDRYVAETESQLAAAVRSPRSAIVGQAIAAEGLSIHVTSGTISDWRGSVFVPGITLDELLRALKNPGTPPPQEDVVSSRLIARDADSLRIAIRLVRRVVVTVTYDTEHSMVFERLSPDLATARTVATRIDEVGGDDRGFLWRLHSYWRYEQVRTGVRIDLRSLTLSRHVPALLRPVAAPLVNRIARESMLRTLDALRRYLVPAYAWSPTLTPAGAIRPIGVPSARTSCS
jgi:hypothetical protein